MSRGAGGSGNAQFDPNARNEYNRVKWLKRFSDRIHQWCLLPELQAIIASYLHTPRMDVCCVLW